MKKLLAALTVLGVIGCATSGSGTTRGEGNTKTWILWSVLLGGAVAVGEFSTQAECIKVGDARHALVPTVQFVCLPSDKTLEVK